MCKRELPEADADHKTKCLECGHDWQLADDNKSIVFDIVINKTTTILSVNQIMRGLKNGIRK